jgi:hypothetical protein
MASSLLQARLARRGVTLSAALTAGVLWNESTSAALPAALSQATVASAVGRVGITISPTVATLVGGALRSLPAGKMVAGMALALTLALSAAGYQLLSTASHPEFQVEQPPANSSWYGPMSQLWQMERCSGGTDPRLQDSKQACKTRSNSGSSSRSLNIGHLAASYFTPSALNSSPLAVDQAQVGFVE